MSLEQQIGALVRASENLTGAVNSKIGEIDKEVDAATKKFDAFITQSRLENAIFRQSKNQYCNLTGANLDYFSKNSQFTIEVSLYREIITGTAWADRDTEEKEILKNMGMNGVQHFQPKIRVMKLIWSGYQADIHSSYTIYPNPLGNMTGCITVASYAKLISGSISDMWLNNVTNEWGLCGNVYRGGPGRYMHAHPRVNTVTGEVLFIWPAIVSGYVPLDRSAPKWGYWPSIYGESPYDVQPGS
ncbi:hypothetical protein C0W42_11470 [Photobacterium kishitanii]|uniref:hypothetical protein n=1 Tax=Photobacterium kishitanii TaxID=318456 RepID=UPI00071AEF88|nr:hypothetical protein [Photobacterium kishitanii]PSU88946.1 hypothetical protein C0W42_11470 [Photobacterium kishitanii]